MLIRISNNYFVAGVITKKKFVQKYPPILKYMKGWHIRKILTYCKKKGWKCEGLSAKKVNNNSI